MTAQRIPLIKKLFLEAYAKTGNLAAAARLTPKMDRRFHYQWLKHDEAYAAAFAAAEEQAIEMLEEEARRRAHDGVTEDVYYLGKVVGHVQKYSDTLLIFLLKAARPEIYRDRYELSGPKGGPVPVKGVLRLEFVNPSPRPGP